MEGLKCVVYLSLETLLHYREASKEAKEELTLGDFIDACVKDSFEVRRVESPIKATGGIDLGNIDFNTERKAVAEALKKLKKEQEFYLRKKQAEYAELNEELQKFADKFREIRYSTD